MVAKQNLEIAFSYAPDLRPGFLAHMANQLDTQICAQTKEVLDEAGVKTPVRSVSVMMHLLKKGPASIADIARAQERSHQLVCSRVAPLENAGLVKTKPDPEDERRNILSLTPAGMADARRLETIVRSIAAVFSDLNEELGVDLMKALEHAEQALRRESIARRISAFPQSNKRKTGARVA